MDHSEHLERMTRIEAVFALVPHTAESAPARDPSASSVSAFVENNITQVITPGIARGGGKRHALSQEQVDDCIARISAQALFEVEQVKLHASESAAVARLSSRRRQSLTYLTYRGLTALYDDTRARARRAFVSECAADVARVKHLASVVGKTRKNGLSDGEIGGCPGALGDVCSYAVDGEVVGPDAAWDRERRRVTAEIEGEASRVACWTRLQREVFRRSTADVLRLLMADSERGPPADGSGVWSLGPREAGAGTGGGGVADSIVAVRKRRRGVLHDLKRRQVEASSEAEGFRRSWMASLALWKAQLGRAQHTVAKRKAAELRVLQRRDAEVSD